MPSSLPNHPDLMTGVRTVEVEAPARLHLGFLDPAGTLGRPFGSLGLTVDAPQTRLSLRASSRADAGPVSADPGVPAAEVERAARHLLTMQQRTGLADKALHLRLHETLPAHAGLGSGTQLALAVGRAFCGWHGLDLPTATLAAWLGRGLRSGVGIAGFDAGGLLLDGGPLAHGAPAPLLARIEVPADWRVLVVTDPATRGLSGDAERAALAQLPPLSREQAAAICHETLMRLLPGCAGAGFAVAAAGLSAIQDVLGQHFAPAQDGEPYTSPAVGRLMRWLRQAAATGAGPDEQGAGIGQSSWGPTGFALLPSAARAQALMGAAQAAGVVAPGLQWRVATPLNRGARLSDRIAAAQPGDAARCLA
ncbi:beta-ribofuranosylaminobenzene 5'-phosphate synthase family protein [Sphaerotilus mobilis]|nr:beta-ribofuranosylaminobenzene 5'-phosphate synthase family protein [Sphaerotilus mobilis]